MNPEEPLMPTTLEALQAEVLRLSPKDRARLLDRLIASLDVDSEAEAGWDALAEQREQEIDSGAVQPVPLELVMARLEARFPG
jgi:putative addiction module component (TIGR02574 family)